MLKHAWVDSGKVLRVNSHMDRSPDLVSVRRRVLLLGPGDSGKSTIFKQALLLYGEGLSERDIAVVTETIRSTIVSGMQALIAACDTLLFEDRSLRWPLSSTLAKHRVKDLPVESSLTMDVALDVQSLWELEIVKRGYEMRSRFQIPDSLGYFMPKVCKVAQSSFMPSREDILRVRVRTLGIVEAEVQIGQDRLTLIDVGGQRSERRKWTHCFENVTAILFVAALSEYDQFLAEAEDVNRMVESLKLFEEIASTDILRRIPIILFLNKCDLFKEKLSKSPLNTLFPAYSGNSYEEACAFMKVEFAKLASKYPREMYVHVTCAIDPLQMRALLEAVRQIVADRIVHELDLN